MWKIVERQQCQELRCRISLDDNMTLPPRLSKGSYTFTSNYMVVSLPQRRELPFLWLVLLVRIWIAFNIYSKPHRQCWKRGWRSTVACWWSCVCFIITTLSDRQHKALLEARQCSRARAYKESCYSDQKKKFARLRHAIEEMHGYMYVPELKEVELCMLSKSHRNQLGMLNCLECTPFSYYPQANL